MKVHHLKIWPKYYRVFACGESTAQLRKNDRDFHEGDTVVLHEFDPALGIFTGHEIVPLPVYKMLEQHEGLTPGWCLLTLTIPASNITKFNKELAGKTALPLEVV